MLLSVTESQYSRVFCSVKQTQPKQNIVCIYIFASFIHSFLGQVLIKWGGVFLKTFYTVTAPVVGGGELHYFGLCLLPLNALSYCECTSVCSIFKLNGFGLF